MATKRAVGTALTVLARAFAGPVTPEKIDLYAAALEDVTDAALEAATVRLVREYDGEFIPNPATIRRAAGANVVPVVDVEGIIERIDRLGSYNPVTGYNAPRVETVRRALGDAIAAAYGAAGGSRLVADNGTTRDIAGRDFARELAAQVQQRGPDCFALPAPEQGRLNA